MVPFTGEDYKKIGGILNDHLKKYNYQVAETMPAGRPGKVVKKAREYRLQLINKTNDTSESLIKSFKDILDNISDNIKNVRYNQISPNSSKFPSYSFDINDQSFDLIIGRGPNKGENFETKTVTDLDKAFKSPTDASFGKLINQLNEANLEFASREIKEVKQRKGSTQKENVPIERLGAIIGDIVLTDTTNQNWYISLKDINGDTFSSYSGAASLFNSAGDIQPDSNGAQFLESFGVDLNKVQEGFDLRNKKKKIREKITVKKPNSNSIKSIFERAWGMNYFYVRKTTSGWKVFWLDRDYLNKLTNSITVSEIKYPNERSKQITILCGNNYQKYLIEIRNSKGGEYPNDTKFKVK